MKINKWTLGLAAVGLVTLPAGVQAEENMSPVMTALSSTTISGYVNTSAHWDLGSGNANPPGYSFNSGKQDGFNLNVVKLSLERPLDESQWAAGYKVDLLFGPDANLYGTQSAQSTASGDFGIQQAYALLRAPVGNGLDFKVGVFDTIIGYETFDAGNNPNYTRSYGYTIEPFSHTGILASYQFSEIFGIAAGVANTYGPAINSRAFGDPDGDGSFSGSESYKTYMGSIALTAPEDAGFMAGSTLYAGVVNGFNNGTGENITSYYAGATVATPIDGLRLGVAYDYADGHHEAGDNSPPPPGSTASDGIPDQHAYAIAGYLSFQATEKLSLHGRAEYAKFSNESVRSAGGAQGGLAEKIFALTGTIQYDLWQNVLSRLEVRWDHQAGGHTGEAFGGNTVGSGRKKNPVLIAANVIYKF